MTSTADDYNTSICNNCSLGLKYITQQEIDMAVDDYGFRVPYDGSVNFYDSNAMKHFRAGIDWAFNKLHQ